MSSQDTGLTADILRQFQSEKLNFPALPEITRNIQNKARDPNMTITELARVVQTDPGLSNHLLRIVNSASLRVFRKIRSCQDAVARLGLQSTRYHTYLYSVRSLYRQTPAGAEKMMHDHALFSTSLAATSSILAESAGTDTETALMGAMLQEIGVIPLIEWVAANTRRFRIKQPDALLNTLISTQARRVGMEVLQQWNFEPAMVELVGERENWLRPCSGKLQAADIINLARIHVHGGIASKRKLPHITLLPAFQKLPERELTEQRTLACLQTLAPEIRALQAALMGQES